MNIVTVLKHFSVYIRFATVCHKNWDVIGQFYLALSGLRPDPSVLLVVLINAVPCNMLFYNLQTLRVVSREW